MSADKTNSRIPELTAAIAAKPTDLQLYIERGKLLYRNGDFAAALNDFLRVRELALPEINAEAEQYITMLQEIFAFRHTDIYNP